MPDFCPHTRWLADQKTDFDGFTTEHCAACGKTRRVYGSWEAIQSANLVEARVPGRIKVFPRLGHDDIDQIMTEINNGRESPKMNEIFKPVTDPVIQVGKTVIPAVKKKSKRQRPHKRPYGFWKINREAIVKDIETLGAAETKKKWNVPESTWSLYFGGVLSTAGKENGAMFCPSCGGKTLIPVYEYIVRFHGAIMAVSEDGKTLIPAVPKEYICEKCKKGFEIKQTLVIC